jgi:GNAT superfamily N-acetyltransferase
MTMKKERFVVRTAGEADIPLIIELCAAVYPDSPTWTPAQLASHQKVFPQGQFVVEDLQTGKLVAYAASLIVYWNDYDMNTSWRDFTDAGMFTNHDPEKGRTLYGAEIMVHPQCQGRGIGGRLYRAREKLCRKLGLLRIRAGARLRDYHKHADRMTAQEYARAVVRGRLRDATLSFQLKRGFHVLGVTSNYLKFDPESRGYAAVIEWINDEVASDEDYRNRHESAYY